MKTSSSNFSGQSVIWQQIARSLNPSWQIQLADHGSGLPKLASQTVFVYTVDIEHNHIVAGTADNNAFNDAGSYLSDFVASSAFNAEAMRHPGFSKQTAAQRKSESDSSLCKCI